MQPIDAVVVGGGMFVSGFLFALYIGIKKIEKIKEEYTQVLRKYLGDNYE